MTNGIQSAGIGASIKITVAITLTNTGKTAGREIVQLCLSAPAIQLIKPSMELKGFAKTAVLAPGESQTVTIDLLPEALVSFDPSRSAWVAASGVYHVHIAASAADIRQTATFILERDIVSTQLSNSLLPANKIEELKPED